MSDLQKYLKYKKKYLQLKGGMTPEAEFSDLNTFLDNLKNEGKISDKIVITDSPNYKIRIVVGNETKYTIKKNENIYSICRYDENTVNEPSKYMKYSFHEDFMCSNYDTLLRKINKIVSKI